MNPKIRKLRAKRKRRELEALSQEELIDLIIEKEEEIEVLNERIKELEGSETIEGNKTKLPDYNCRWNWISKIVFLITAENKPLTSAGILAALSINDYHYRNSCESNLEGKLRVHIHKACEYGRIKKYKIPGLKTNYYGLLEWFNENDKPFPQYKVQPDFF